MKHVLFLCSGNTCRSPMAEAIAKEVFLKKGINANVSSRGIYAFHGERVSENAVLAMDSIGIDIRHHTAKRISHTDINKANYIFAMTQSHKGFVESIASHSAHKLFTIGEYSGHYTDVHDPYGGNINNYIACATELRKFISNVADRLLEESEEAEEEE